MKTILADFQSLVVVTDEMRKLRECPECHGEDQYICGCGLSGSWDDIFRGTPAKDTVECRGCRRWHEIGRDGDLKSLDCPTCKSTGLNPDQSKWWESLAKAKRNDIWNYFATKEDLTVFNCIPDDENWKINSLHGDKWLGQMIHRPFNDMRPWPEVLRDLIMGIMEPDGEGADYLLTNGNGYSWKEKPSFALATPETAPVFKSFGIETIGRL